MQRSGIHAELELLRQRGLATVLNKHFTETTHKLVLEKAAADAALHDLERRKAQTSEFHPSGDGELSPLDAMYLSVTQWRSECRRKERETLLLYQRYVDKFGATGQVKVPLTHTTTSTASATNHNNNNHGAWNTPRSSSTAWQSPIAHASSPSWSPANAAPPPHTPPSPPEDAAATARHAHPRPPLDSLTPNHGQVPSMAAAIEAALEDYLAKGALALPSIETLTMDETYQTAFSKEEAEFRNFYRRQLERKGVDAKATPPKTLEELQASLSEVGRIGIAENPWALSSSSSDPFLRTIGEQDPNCDNDDDDDDDEEDSAEQSDDDKLGPLLVHATDDDESIMSGLTFNSALTREILDDCNRTVATFLQEEKEAIRQLLLEEQDHMDAMTCNQSQSDLGSVCLQAAEQAEHMAKQMQEILDNFADKAAQKQNQDEEQASVRKQQSQGKRFETGNPNEEWIEYYDETYARNYYHEVRSNRTQWNRPDLYQTTTLDGTDAATTCSASVARSTSPTALTADDVRPERSTLVMTTESRRLSRISQYRRRRRRQRKRRMLVAALAFVLSFLSLAYFLHKHPQSSLAHMPVVRSVLPVANLVINMDRLDQWILATSKQMNHYQRWLQGQAPSKAEEERLAQMEAQRALELEEQARMAAEQAAKEAQLARQREQDRMRQEQEAAARRLAAAEAERKHRQEQERLEAERLAREEYLRRPWQCNVPFAYLFHERCMDLADANPPFDCHELIMTMMQ